MGVERWKQVEELFEAARQKPAADRAGFLREASAGDPSLASEVESLLRAAESGDSFLDGAALSSLAERPPTFKSGDTLGNFQILSLLGRGGMGEVWRARDPRLKRDVAIKVLPGGMASNPGQIARFEREARAASALNHPNIVVIHDVGRDGDVMFIVSEVVEGETLAQMLERGPLPLPKLIAVGAQICEGLAAAHASGVVHRDLKPGNIMLTREGRVKILDFGLARQDRALGADSSTMEVSQRGVILGTAGYMSPEQVRGESTDARSDLFSLGLILYEMASGKRAFSGSSSVEVMNSILKDEPPELPPASPTALDRMVRRCIEKQQARRFQSAADLGFALNAVSSTLAIPTLFRQRPKRSLISVTVFLVLGVAAAAAWVTRSREAPRIANTTQITNDGINKAQLFSYGDRLLFTSYPEHKLFQVSAKGGPTTSLELDSKILVADVSPDLTELLECVARPAHDGVELWVGRILGGTLRRVGSVIASRNASFCPASFSPDGRNVVYGWMNEIRVIGSDGSGDRKLASFPDYLSRVRWSPDGSRIRFSVFQPPPGNPANSLWEVPVSGGQAVPMLSGWNVLSGVWTPDGRYFLFEADREGSSTIWALPERSGFFDRRSREPFRLTSGPMEGYTPIASPDGKRVFFIGATTRFEFVRYDPESHQVAPALSGLSGTDLEYSKDGKWFVYVSVPEGTLWRCGADATGCLELTTPPLIVGIPHWSPDGKTIAFAARIPGSLNHIYLVPAGGGAAPKQVTNGEAGPAGEADSSWSPDGSSLAFAQSYGSSIQVLDVESKRISKLSGSDDMWSPRWSPDGLFIAGLSKESENLILYDCMTRRQVKVFDGGSACPVWADGGKTLYFKNHNVCWRMRLSDRKAERVVDFTKEGIGAGWGWFALMPGNRIITARDVGTHEIYAMDWTEDRR